METTITKEMLESFHEQFTASRANLVAMNAVTGNGVKASANRWTAQKDAVHQYSIRLDNKGMTYQKSSGRCWMFAALNCLRYQIIHKLNLENFELSQSYTCFYDKLEKSNYFLENILNTLEEPTEGRLIDYLLSSPIQDGGQWDMISALIMKYGVVPKSAMPESFSSSNTGEMNAVITTKLREFACTLRTMAKEGKSMEELRAEKESMMATVYRMLCICLGTPPETFDFEIRDKDNHFICDYGMTPKSFYDKYICIDLTEYVSVINAPTQDKPYMRSYTVKYLGNVMGGTPVRYVNLPIEELKKAAIAQMKDGEPVWFGCDVGKESHRKNGTMDLNAYDMGALFDTTFPMTKAQRLDYHHSQMTHAMVFQGVDLKENGEPIRWCVENSWGEDAGAKGMYLMTDDWFNEYMYQIVVQKKYLSDEILAAYYSEPIALEPWDPMGSLA